MYKFKTGDIVDMESWEEIIAEGTWVGTIDPDNFEFGKVYFPQDAISFPEYAQYLCGRQFTVCIDCVNKGILAEIDGIFITENMVKLVEAVKE
jgi:hypothetical protein